MNESRAQAYLELINALLTCPNGEEPEILHANSELLDLEFLEACEAVATIFAEEGEENKANFLRNIASQLGELLGMNEREDSENSEGENSRKYLEFIQNLLQAERENSGSAVIYPMLAQRQHLLNARFAEILQQVAENLIAEHPQAIEFIVAIVENLSIHIQDFPLGNRANNIEIAITGYQIVLSNREPGSEKWAQTQNNLGTAYYNRIRGDTAENIEHAIRYYTAALEVRTRQAFPQDWAGTQNNLGLAYSERIRGDRAENIEQAIACNTAALEIYTRQAFPQYWAGTQNNLGLAYKDRIREDRAENIEQAIRCFKAALEIYTRQAFPQDWATTQNNRGLAYSERIREDRAENIEQAIRCFKAALEIYTRQAFPQDWATTQNNLGLAYNDRIRGEKAENIEQAIRYYTAALEVRTCEAFPQDWATTQNNLGTAYLYRIRGEKAENIEQAIRYYTAALSVYTREAFPQYWAMTHNNLGLAYNDRIRGEKAENIENAIRYYTAALEVRTREAFPQDWAGTQNNLAIAYKNRIRGEKAENIENAIRYYTAALSVYTREAFPEQWAMTQNNLATAYKDRIRGEKAENIENAIRYYTAALSVYTRQAFPQDWAMTQNNLAAAYYNIIREDRAENIEQAIRCFKAALEVRTREALPQNHARTLFNLGLTYRKLPNLQLARNTFADAIDTVEFLRGEIYSGDESKQKLAEEYNRIYLGMVEVCIALKHYTEAIEYVERSKARNLVELLATRDLYPKGDIPQGVRTEVQRLRQEIEVEKRRLAADSTPDYTLVNQLRQRYNELYPFEPIQFDQIQNLIGDRTAIIQWYIFEESFCAFAITRHHPQPLVWQSSTEEWENLENWANNYLGAYYTPRQAETDAEREKLEKHWQDTLANRLQKLAEILHITDILNNLLEIPATFDRLVLIPHRYLHLFPLHALPVSRETWLQFNPNSESSPANPYLLDCFVGGVGYAPSCQLLQQAQMRQRPNFSHLFAIQNPTQDLHYTDLEVKAIAQHFQPSDILANAAAKIEALDEQRLRNAHCAHFSCHGYFNLEKPLQSALLLADSLMQDGSAIDLSKCLTLENIFTRDFSACRLIVLSACETGLTDFSSLSDEYIGLPSGFLVAGSPSVVSSLWAVNDLSTALLMMKFYQNLKAGLTVTLALNTAQTWLRNATKEELINQLDLNAAQRMQLRFQLRNIDANTKLFESPYHWAAFCAIGQ